MTIKGPQSLSKVIYRKLPASQPTLKKFNADLELTELPRVTVPDFHRKINFICTDSNERIFS